MGHERDPHPLSWQPRAGVKQSPFSDRTTTDRGEEERLLPPPERSRFLLSGSRRSVVEEDEDAVTSSRTLDAPSSVSVAVSAAKAATAAAERKRRKGMKHALKRRQQQRRRRAEMLRRRRQQRQRSTSSSSSSSSSSWSSEESTDDDEVGRARWEKERRERPAKAEEARKSQCESIGDCYNGKRIRNEEQEEQGYFLGSGNGDARRREQERRGRGSVSPQEKVLSPSAIVSQSRLSGSTALKSWRREEGNISQSLPRGPYSEVQQQKQLVKRSSYYDYSYSYCYYNNSGDAAAEEGFVPAHPTSQQLEHLNSRRRAYGDDDRGKRGSSPLIPKSDQQHQSFKAAGIEREEEEEGRATQQGGEKWDHDDDAHCKQLESERVSMPESLSGSREGIMETYVVQQQQPVPQQQVMFVQDTANGYMEAQQHQQQACMEANGMMTPQQTIVSTDHYQQQPQTAVPYFQQQQQQQQPQRYFVQQANSQSPMYFNPFSGVSPGQSSVDSGYVYGVDSSPYVGMGVGTPMSVSTTVAEPASVMSNSNSNAAADDDPGFVGSPAVMTTPSHAREEDGEDNSSKMVELERILEHQTSQDEG